MPTMTAEAPSSVATGRLWDIHDTAAEVGVTTDRLRTLLRRNPGVDGQIRRIGITRVFTDADIELVRDLVSSSSSSS